MSTSTVPVVILTDSWCTSGAYDYPRASGLHHTKHVLAVVHQAVTGPIWAESAIRTRNTPGYVGNTATWYCDALPDGSAHAYHFIDGTKHVAWGGCPDDYTHFDTSNPGVALVRDHALRGINPNECVVEQLEWSGSGPEPWTTAQFEAAAIAIARASRATGIPIDRTTVLAHRDFDLDDRPSDPWPPETREARMAQLITRARELAAPPEADMDPLVIPDTLCAVSTGPLYSDPDCKVEALHSFTGSLGVGTYGLRGTSRALRIVWGRTPDTARVCYVPIARVTNVRPRDQQAIQAAVNAATQPLQQRITAAVTALTK